MVSVASCALVNPDAVAVNEWHVSRRDFQAALAGVSADPDASRLFGLSSRAGGTTGTAVVATADAAKVLGGLVNLRLAADEVARRGITPTDADRTEALTPTSSGSQGDTTTDLRPAIAKLGPLAQTVTDGLVALVALRRTFADADPAPTPDLSATARETFDQAKAQLAKVCFSAIVFRFPTGETTNSGLPPAIPVPGSADDVATKKRAEDALAKLAFGADFAELARGDNDDATGKAKGGDQGCQQGSQLPEAVRALAPGKVSDIIPLPQTGYALVKVTSVEEAKFEDYQTEIEQYLRQQIAQQRQQEQAGKVREAVVAAAKKAVVRVDPLYGTWDAEALAVAPPDGARPAPTTPVSRSPLTPLESLGTEPEGTSGAPSGTAPSGTAPSGTAPSGTAPSGTAPTATAPGAGTAAAPATTRP